MLLRFEGFHPVDEEDVVAEGNGDTRVASTLAARGRPT